MAIKVASNFEVGTGLPIDDRYVFGTIAERDALEAGRLYEGLVTYVKATQRRYIYDGLKWRDITDRNYVLDLTGATNENVADYRLRLSDFAPKATSQEEVSAILPYKITVIGRHTLEASARVPVIQYIGGFDYNPAGGTKLIIENLTGGSITVGEDKVADTNEQIAPESGIILLKDNGDNTYWTKTGGYSLADYEHPTGDGNLHVPATGTSNNGKFLMAGNTQGSFKWASITKSAVGLGNVDNTSDVDKPVSTAQQTAIDNAKTGAINEAKGYTDTAKTEAVNTAKSYTDTKTGAAKTEAVNTAKSYTDDEVQKVKDSVNGLLAANDAMVFKGVVNFSEENFLTNVVYRNEWQAGWTWKAGESLRADGLWQYSPALEAGDVIIAVKDHPAAAWTSANLDGRKMNETFHIIQANIDGAVTGPTAATSGSLPVFDGVSGKVIRDSGVKLKDLAEKGDVEYTNDLPTTTAVGGIPKGTTFKDKPVAEMFQMLLYPYVKPSVSLSSSTAKVFEKGTTQSVTMNVNVTVGSKALTTVGLYNGATSIKALTAKAGSQSASINITATTTVTAKAGDGTNTATSSGVTFTAVDPFYVGVVASAPTTSDAVKALTKKVEAKGEKKITHTTTASAGRYCFCYPKSYGAIKTVLDGNGFDNTSDYAVSTVSVTTAAGEAVDYYVYTYKNVVVPGTMTMTYKF